MRAISSVFPNFDPFTGKSRLFLATSLSTARKWRLRLARAYDLDSANRVLRHFRVDYNRRFTRSPREAAKAWRSAPEKLERICCFRYQRVVSNDNVVQWEGRPLQIPPL